MIEILAKNYSQAVNYLCDKFDAEIAKYDLTITRSKSTVSEVIKNVVSNGCSALIIVGNVGDSCADFSETLGLATFYDKFAESNILKFCKYAQAEIPPQYIMDRLCLAPEAFNHLAPVYGYQCACYGEYNKKQIFFVPDDLRECSVVYDNYISRNLFKSKDCSCKYTFKIFGLSQKDVEKRLEKLNRNVLRKQTTVNLDTKLVLMFAAKTPKAIINDALKTVNEVFSENIYATSDKTIAQTVVELLKNIGQTLSTAESMTGGLIASSIVDVPGASSVLYEGAVTYSIQSKCKRLDINPHFIDEYGVISQQVAQSMAVGLLKNGSNIAVSITGNAGPTSEDGQPVGLCYIGIATERNVAVYKNNFMGDRNAIRAQAANMALFLALKTLTK